MFRFSKLYKKLVEIVNQKSSASFYSLSRPAAFSPSVAQRHFHTRGFFPKLQYKEELSRIENKAKEKCIESFTKEELERVRQVFAEGYMAGRMGSVTGPSRGWRILIALFSGIVLGFFLPLVFLANVKVKMDKDFEIDGKRVRTKFKDVKGVDEAKQELQDMVHFLKSPGKFTMLGGKLPRGVLLVGPPGTGKTLLARALAGEAGVPYFHMSGSEFEQTYVGEGARRVRDLFKVAKRNAPCVVFIDEIDSVGSKRMNSPMHPHSNQTINQLLTEMDGFIKNEGVIVVAATNRREDLDPALLRPGRFDIEIAVTLPGFFGRKEIFAHYLSSISCEPVDLDKLARGTVGFTGADIENMVNRSALRAALDGAKIVTGVHLFAERDRILMGPENKTRVPDQNAKAIAAYHEGGHCLVAMFTPDSLPVHKVSIVPRGDSLGHTAYLPEKDEVYVTKAQLMARIDALMGGRAAEELIFGANFVTSGAASDLEVASELASRMVGSYCMSEKVGLRVGRGEKDGPSYKDSVDQEVQKILSESYERAKTLLKKHSLEHSLVAEALLQYETLDAKEIHTIVRNKKIPR